MIEFKITEEHISMLLKGKQINYNNEVIIHPPQKGMFITNEELDEIIRDRTNMTERLLNLMENKQK